MLLSPSPEIPDPETAAILRRLETETYDQIRQATGWSRGRIYQAALRHNARKTEARIQERAADRRRRQKEQLEALLNETAVADVLDFLDGMPENSVQATITSPPYNVGKGYGGAPGADMMRHQYFIGWLMQIVSETARVLSPGGVAFFQVGTTRDDAGGRVPLDIILFDLLKSAGLTYQSRVVWLAPHGLTPRRRLAERYETALVFSKGTEARFNPGAARVPQKDPAKRAFKGPNKGQLSGHPLGAWPTDVWTLSHVGHNHPDQADHPAQFPVSLARRAMLLYTLPGDLVMDPFSGSGSTQIAALRTGRQFVGSDLFYEDVRKSRLAKAFPELVSDLSGVTDESLAVWQAQARRRDVPALPLTAEEEATQLRLAFG